MPFGADAFSPHDLEQGAAKDPDIEPQAPVIHIPNVGFESFVPGECVSSVNLCPTRDAWSELVTANLFRNYREISISSVEAEVPPSSCHRGVRFVREPVPNP